RPMIFVAAIGLAGFLVMNNAGAHDAGHGDHDVHEHAGHAVDEPVVAEHMHEADEPELEVPAEKSMDELAAEAAAEAMAEIEALAEEEALAEDDDDGDDEAESVSHDQNAAALATEPAPVVAPKPLAPKQNAPVSP